MARFIDVDKIDTEKAHKRNEIYYRDSFESGVVSTLHLLAKMPTADVVEVKRGEWLNIIFTQRYICSLCGNEIYFGKDKFCSECGAKMDGTLKERGGEK